MSAVSFDLQQCLEGVRQNQQQAGQALVEHLYSLVTRIVRAHLPRQMAEEDLAQEVFLKLFSRLAQYRQRDGIPFEHWVSRVAVRTCLDHLRAERRRRELRWADLSEESVAWLRYVLLAKDPPPDASPKAAREVIETLLRQLPPKDRLVIGLLDLEQHSVKEISRITGWSVTLVKVRAFRARRRLRSIAAKLESAVPHE